MKNYPTNKIRNIGILAHGGSGKTLLTEAILFNSGVIKRMGSVENGNTVTDYAPEEIARNVTINLSLAPIEWKDTKINILDTPGYADFYGEVVSALSVIDGAVLLVDAASGVEVRTEIVWEQLKEKNIPRVLFINKMDRENADFYRTVEQIKELFGNNIAPIQLPIGKEDEFSGIVDIISNKAFNFENGKAIERDIPEEIKAELDDYKEQILEIIAENDDELLLKYLEGEEITPKEFQQGLVNSIKQGAFIPILCGSAIKNIGVTPLMDLLTDYMPSPDEALQKDLKDMEKDTLSALVFKTLADPYVGKVSFFKVFGGIFKPNINVFNPQLQEEEKISNIYTMRGKELIPVDELRPGDIGVVTKLSKTTTGNTLTLKNTSTILEEIVFPKPTLAFAVAPKNKGDEDKLGNGISRILDEDKTITFEKNKDTKETIITCMGELHLDIVIEKLKKRYGVEIETKVPMVPYRETIKKKVQRIEGKHKKQTGGHGQYGHVFIDMEPLYEGEFEFHETIFGGAVPKQYIPAVEKGILEAMEEGVLARFPVTNIKVTLVDGSYHTVDSSEMAFKIAASLAFKKAMEQASPVLLEPIMKVEVTVPEQYMGDIMGDLNGKRGRILGMEPKGKNQVINAHVPLAEMFSYPIDLRSITQGRGSFKMEFAQYEEVPANLAEKIIEERAEENN